jgi:large-conductance mechanosensitive channel
MKNLKGEKMEKILDFLLIDFWWVFIVLYWIIELIRKVKNNNKNINNLHPKRKSPVTEQIKTFNSQMKNSEDDWSNYFKKDIKREPKRRVW